MFAVVGVSTAFLGADYHVVGLGSVTGAVGLLGFMTAAAVTEELLFRGVLFRVVEERTGTWIALLLSGAVFGAGHLFNPDASVWGAIAIAVEAGFMLAACYAATRTLWVPIGLRTAPGPLARSSRRICGSPSRPRADPVLTAARFRTGRRAGRPVQG